MYMYIFGGKDTVCRQKIVWFVSANCRGGFFTRHNLSVYAKEVKTYLEMPGKDKRWEATNSNFTYKVNISFSSLDILLKQWLLLLKQN